MNVGLIDENDASPPFTYCSTKSKELDGGASVIVP